VAEGRQGKGDRGGSGKKDGRIGNGMTGRLACRYGRLAERTQEYFGLSSRKKTKVKGEEKLNNA